METLTRSFLVVALAVTLLAGACSKPADSTPHVRMAVGGQTLMVYLPAVLAQELGFYREEGVDVELQDFQGGAKALQALIGGSADVVCGYYDHTIQMAAEQRELVEFVSMLRYPGFVLATSPQSSASVTGIPQLRGKVVGVTSPGSSTQMFLTFLLTRNQVPVDSVSVTAIGASASAIAAVEHGTVAAGWMADPAYTLVRKRNPAVHALADLRSEEGTLAAFGTATYPGAVLYSSAEWVRAYRDVAARLARAIVRTLDWMHTHSAAEITAKTPKAVRGEDDALFTEALGNSMAMFSTDGVMPAAGAEAVRKTLAESMPKVAAATIDLSKTYTNEFVTAR